MVLKLIHMPYAVVERLYRDFGVGLSTPRIYVAYRTCLYEHKVYQGDTKTWIGNPARRPE